MNCRRKRQLTISLFVGFSLALLANASAGQPSLPSFIQALDVGDVPVQLSPPVFADGLSPDEEAALLKEVAGKYPLERFAKDSIVAPFTLARESIKNASGQRIGHRVDLGFIAHGSLKAIRDEDLFGAMLETDSNEPGSGESVSKEELSSRGIEIADSAEEAYYQFAAPILDQVMVRGVVHAKSHSTPESHFAAIALADEFLSDDSCPNTWEHIKGTPPTPKPFSGFAGYAKATKLKMVPGAVFIECHAVLHEPVTWFKSPNLLSSKLPLVTQDTVRSFRRTLAKRSR